MKKQFLIILTLFIFSLFLPSKAFSAFLYLEPVSGQYYQRESFLVEVRLDTQGECVNAVEVGLVFPDNLLEVRDFNKANSLFSLWVKEPKFFNEAGAISFAGGMPGGYCGILPGDPGQSNLLGTIIFQSIKTPLIGQIIKAPLNFSAESQVLLNDGQGRLANLTTRGALFSILPGIVEQPRDQWQETIAKDKTPPEIFQIKLFQDPNIFQGQHFISFFTTDKQTGIAFYRVKEGDGEWQKAKSPYPLEDQALTGTIEVGAVDKAGNVRLAQLEIEQPSWVIWLWPVALLAIFALSIWIRRKREK